MSTDYLRQAENMLSEFDFRTQARPDEVLATHAFQQAVMFSSMAQAQATVSIVAALEAQAAAMAKVGAALDALVDMAQQGSL